MFIVSVVIGWSEGVACVDTDMQPYGPVAPPRETVWWLQGLLSSASESGLCFDFVVYCLEFTRCPPRAQHWVLSVYNKSKAMIWFIQKFGGRENE